MKYKIEKNIPIPPKKDIVYAFTQCETFRGEVFMPNGERARQNKYPFKKMKIGESFLVDNKYSRELMCKYANAGRVWKNKTGRKDWQFTTRRTTEGIRIWREL